MIYPSHDDWAWLAGFVDGEGCILIHYGIRRNRSKPRFEIRLQISHTDAAALEWIANRWGGVVSGGKVPQGTFIANLPQWVWMISGDAAAEILRRFRVKHQQAWLAQEAWAQRTRQGFGYYPLSVEERALREGYALASRYLNSGVRANA